MKAHEVALDVGPTGKLGDRLGGDYYQHNIALRIPVEVAVEDAQAALFVVRVGGAAEALGMDHIAV